MRRDAREVVLVDGDHVVVVVDGGLPVNGVDDDVLDQHDGKQVVEEHDETGPPSAAYTQTPAQT